MELMVPFIKDFKAREDGVVGRKAYPCGGSGRGESPPAGQEGLLCVPLPAGPHRSPVPQCFLLSAPSVPVGICHEGN